MKICSEIRKQNGKYTWYVDGKPFIALGGELHNSSCSDLDYMERRVWPSLRPLHMNTVLAPVYWECIEPIRGQYDFALVDGLIDQARREGVRLILLWFGLWKNAESTYVPEWMKLDSTTYFRMRTAHGEPLESISPLCQKAVDADALCYRRLMAHIRDYDAQTGTVIMMQVENEIGVLGSDRDFSAEAEAAFTTPVPAVVSEAYGVSGTWSEAFGLDAPELFMGCCFASAVEQITQAGQAEYPLPMYVNAWMEKYPWLPGTYPSGGPQAKIMKMWKTCAPSLALNAPDIYVDYFRDVCDEYSREDNPLFIPETMGGRDAAPFLYYAVGKHNALGFSPFGIESTLQVSTGNPEQDALDALDVSRFRDPTGGAILGAAYQQLSGMIDLIEKAHAEGRIYGFLEQHDTGVSIQLKKYDVKINFTGSLDDNVMFGGERPGRSGGMMIVLDDDDLLFVGIGYSVVVVPKPGETTRVRLLRKEEGCYENGVWKRGRILNGDEANYTRMKKIPSMVRLKLYQIK